MQADTRQHDLLTVADTAERLGVSAETVRRAIARGELSAVTLGERGRYRVTRDALDRFLRPARARGNP